MNAGISTAGNYGKPITIYVYEKNITSGFRSTGIVSLNRNILDSDFLALNVTDR